VSPDDTVKIVCDRCCSHVCDGHEICAADGEEPVAELNHCAGEPLQHSELATSRDDFSTQLKDRSVVFVEFIDGHGSSPVGLGEPRLWRRCAVLEA